MLLHYKYCCSACATPSVIDVGAVVIPVKLDASSVGKFPVNLVASKVCAPVTVVPPTTKEPLLYLL